MSRKHSENHFAQPMTDLMAGVAVTFLLIAAIFMVQAAAQKRKATAEKERAEKRLSKRETGEDAARARLTRLDSELRADPNLRDLVESKYAPSVDPFLLTIVFNRSRLSFDNAGCGIRPETLEAIKAAKPLFTRLCSTGDTSGSSRTDHDDERPRIEQSITLEGHTDRHPDFEPSTQCGIAPSKGDRDCSGSAGQLSEACIRMGFENNVRLSAARAQNVFFQARQAFRDDSVILKCLDESFVVVGRGPVEPEAGGNWRDSPADSNAYERDRRVVIKVRVRLHGLEQDGQ